jgi:S1-C subfamily serine protease
MIDRRAAAIAVVAAACLSTAAGADLGAAEQAAFRAAVARVAAAVVRVETAGVSAAPVAAEAAAGAGPSTGIVVDADGWIVATEFAVPRDMKQAIVVLWPREGGASARTAAAVVGRDLSRGLVLLKTMPPFPLASLAEGVARESLDVGQWTIAVGRGWGGDAPSVGVGVLSATQRAWGKAVQTDASVSPANYGGPLVDIEGRPIGILAPLPADMAGMNLGTELYDSGIGFAVPLEDVVRVLPRLRAGETLTAGLLGISYRARDVVTAAATIATVRAGSPAAQAGMRPGDTVVSVGGRPVTRIAELRHAIMPLYAGDTIDIVVERPRKEGDPERLPLRATLAASLPPWRRAVVGIVPRRVAATKQAAAAQPLVIDWVWPDGPAAKAGIAAGATLTGITVGETDDAIDVDAAAAVAGALGGLEVGQTVTLKVKDAGGRETTHRLATAAMPTDLPATMPERPEPPDAATVVKLEAPEIAAPPVAVIPAGDKTDPVGVLVFFGQPHGGVAEAEAAPWLQAANRHGVAVILPGSSDPQRWGREDIAGVARSLDSLRSRRALDPTRIAVAGRGAGGAFAWLVAESLGPAVRGVALVDSALPRQAKIEAAEPGRSRWILFGAGKEPVPRVDADRQRLIDAGHDVGMLPPRTADAVPVEALTAFAEAVGLL